MISLIKFDEKNKQNNLDPDKKELLASFEKGEWKREKKRARKIATRTLRKDVRINIRLSQGDVSNIKQRAAYEGLPYQTLIASVLHKYAAGHLDLAG